jgi:nitroreductase
MRRLKPDPVLDELIRKILNAGVSAPSGGNMQRWRFIVVRDAKVKQMVGNLISIGRLRSLALYGRFTMRGEPTLLTKADLTRTHAARQRRGSA